MKQLRTVDQIVEFIPNMKNGHDLGYLNDTINLEQSIEDVNREETVRLYYFANTIKTTFEEILQAFAEPEGRGFWITAEYGVGKSHFLATLACLLGDTSENLWNRIHDAEIKNYRFRFKDQKLFPVVCGLRGKSAINAERPITLLSQIEKEIEHTISKLKLSNLIDTTPIQETLNLYDGYVPALKSAIDDFVRNKSGMRSSEVRAKDVEKFASFVSSFFKESNLPFEPAYNTEDRLKHLYNLIVNQRTGYDGILLIIDEYEAWLSQRELATPEGLFDSNVLQTLVELLPTRHNCKIYTIVASQREMPSQLQGSKRFTYRPLLAGKGAERDYHVICAHRVRQYRQGGETEAKQYYHQLYDEFGSYKDNTVEQFLETFPFHPLSYEIVRRFTSNAGEPGLRLGINILYDLMKDGRALKQTKPLIPGHLLSFSPNLQRALEKPQQIDGYRKYIDAIDTAKRVIKEETDKELAADIITTLYLYYVVYQEQALPLKPAQLAEATLTGTNGITGEERVFVLLSQMVGQISQILFDPTQPDNGARFIPKKSGPTPRELLDELKRDPLIVNNATDRWSKLLFMPVTQTMGIPSLFTNLELDKPNKEKCTVNQIEYDGEFIITHSWRSDLGQRITHPYTHFRIVYLLNPTSFPIAEIEDPRIIVLQPSQLSDQTLDAIKELLASEKLKSDYAQGRQSGPDAADIRAYAESQYNNMLSSIINGQIKQFLQGKAFTKNGLNIDIQAACAKPTTEQRHQILVRTLLTNAYTELQKLFVISQIDKPVQLQDAKNLFVGLLQDDSNKAVRSTLEQKAVGLGLSLSQQPRQLNAENSELFKFFTKRLEEKNGAVTIYPLLKELANPPYGIPSHLFAVQMLLFVRCRIQPCPVEIELNPGHKVITVNGTRLGSNRITRSNVREIAWQNGIEENFVTLIEAKGTDWNSIVPFAQVILTEAKTALQPNEIDKQTEAFLSHLKEENQRIKAAEPSLAVLQTSFDQRLLEQDAQAFRDVSDLTNASDLESFDEKRRKISEDAQAIKQVYEKSQQLMRLSDMAASLIQKYESLKKLDLGSEAKLAAERDILLPRFSIHSLSTSPTAAKGLLDECEKYLEKVASAKELHAKRMKEELQKLLVRLQEVEPIVKSLELLNTLEMLGTPLGLGLSSETVYLTKQISKELTGGSKAHEELSYRPPKNEIEGLFSSATSALEKRLSILRSELEKIIAQGENNELSAVLKLIQIGNIVEVGKKLTPALADAMRKLLEKANTITQETKVLDQLALKFPTIGVDDVDSVVAEFRKLLIGILGDGNKSGKKLKITLK